MSTLRVVSTSTLAKRKSRPAPLDDKQQAPRMFTLNMRIHRVNIQVWLLGYFDQYPGAAMTTGDVIVRLRGDRKSVV